MRCRAIGKASRSRLQQTFAMQTLGGAGLLEKPDRSFFEHPRAHAAKYIVRAPPLKHDVVNTGIVQQLGKDQSRRTRSDDPYLCLQERPRRPFG